MEDKLHYSFFNQTNTFFLYFESKLLFFFSFIKTNIFNFNFNLFIFKLNH